MKKLLLSAAAALFTLTAPPLFAGDIQVSVLYFTNLGRPDAGASGENYIGKALAEFSAGEFGSVKGITLIERNRLETLMKEMELSLTGVMDERSAPKLGKLLGANILIDGSYLVSGTKCTVSYKILSTEKGSILKTGIVNGSTSDIYGLVNAMSIAAAGGLKEAFPEIDISRINAQTGRKMNIESAARFGEALDLSDSGRHTEAARLLEKLRAGNPDYAIFKKALNDLDKRIRDYDKARDEAMKREAEQPLTWNVFMKLTASYSAGMKQSKLYELCMKMRKNPPTVPDGYMIDSPELIDYYIISSLNALNRHPETIHEGEIFLKKYPSSVYYNNAKMYIRLASDSIKEREKSKLSIDAAIQEIEKKFDAQGQSIVRYHTGLEFYSKKFYKEAIEHFRKIDLRELHKIHMTGDAVIFYIFQCQAMTPDRKSAEKTLRTMETLYPDSTYLSGMKTQADFIAE